MGGFGRDADVRVRFSAVLESPGKMGEERNGRCEDCKGRVKLQVFIAGEYYLQKNL